MRGLRWLRRGVALSVLLFAGCAVMTVGKNPGNHAAAYFAEHDPAHGKPQFETLRSDGVTIAYARVGDGARPVVLFVHGTPGRWGDFVHFLADRQLQQQANLVALDRPGWGGSPFDKAPQRVTLALQSHSLEPLLQQLAEHSGGCGVVLVGHSLGGSLVARMVMDYPQWVRGVVVLAGSIDPELGKPRWYNTLASVAPFRWLTPQILAHANSEIMPLHDDLLAMQAHWREVRIPLTFIQGGGDRLVAPGNASFARSVLPAAQLRVIKVPDEGHFLLWDRPQMVTDAIVDMLSRSQGACVHSQSSGRHTAPPVTAIPMP